MRGSYGRVPCRRERCETVEGHIIDAVEDNITIDDNVVGHCDCGGSSYCSVSTKRQGACSKRTAGHDRGWSSRRGHAIGLIERSATECERRAACTKDEAASGDINATRERAACAREAEETCTGFYNATILDVGSNIQTSLPRSYVNTVDDRGTN